MATHAAEYRLFRRTMSRQLQRDCRTIAIDAPRSSAHPTTKCRIGEGRGWAELAKPINCGIFVSTAFSLLVVPMVYLLINRKDFIVDVQTNYG